MKVKMTDESKKIITMSELKIAKQIISDLKESEETEEECIKTSIAHTGSWCETIYKSSARIAKNCRILNFYSDESKDIDVWIEAEAKTSDGFMIIGFYLSDAWLFCDDSEINKNIISHMYIRKFIAEEAKK